MVHMYRTMIFFQNFKILHKTMTLPYKQPFRNMFYKIIHILIYF